jgi:predicted ATPase/DNA-binding CsgD family transcriptional regulator
MEFGFPTPLTPFIGRKSELEQLHTLLLQPDVRCISIVGPGGVGKTRLALALAEIYYVETRLATYVVPLLSTNRREQIVLVLAQAIGLNFYDDTALEQQLLDYLHDKQMLLVFDNMEHLVQESSFISVLLTAAPKVKLLVTSREQLNLRSEIVFTMSGFSVTNWRTLDEAISAEAVQFFLQRAQRTSPKFNLTDHNLKGIYRIAQLAEGIPLGIELAAAWVNTLSIDEIADEIEHSAQFLEARFRDTPSRHWSIWATFQSSWERLSLEERESLTKLSIFSSSFTRQAAKHIANADIRILQLLVQKSLLTYTENGRFRIHNLLRQFLSAHLEPAEQAALHQIHSQYYLSWLQQLMPGIKGSDQQVTLDQIEQEFDQLRAAWETALQNQNRAAIQIAQETLFWFCLMRNRYVEGENLFERADQAAFFDLTAASVKLHRLWLRRWREGAFSIQRGDHLVLQDLLEWFKQVKEVEYEAKCKMLLADAYRVSSDHRLQSKPLLEESLRQFQASDEPFYTAWVLHFMAREALTDSGISQAVMLQQHSLELRRQIHDVIGTIYALYNLSTDWLQMGALDASKAAAEEMLELSLNVNEQSGALMAYSALSLNALLTGDPEQAAALNSEVVALASNLNHPLGQSYGLLINALLAILQDQPSAAQEYFDMLGQRTVQDLIYFFQNLGMSMLELNTQHPEASVGYLSRSLSYALRVMGTGSLLWSVSVGAVWAAQLHDQKFASQLSLIVEETKLQPWLQNWRPFSRLLTSMLSEPSPQSISKPLLLEQAAQELLYRLSPGTPESQFSAQVMSANAALLEPLSSRELEVLMFIAQGASNQEIADQLFVELSTVKKHITNIYGKLSVNSRAKAILTAQERGLV